MTERSLGYELWNAPETLYRRISDDAMVYDNVHHLLTDVSKAQEEFGKKIRKTVTSYSKSQRGDESSMHSAFNALVQFLHKLGCDLESDARDTISNVLNPLKTLYNSHKKDIDYQFSAIQKVFVSMNTTKKMIENSWSKYYKSFVQYELAIDVCRSDMEDKTQTAIEHQKSKEAMEEKKKEYETVMEQYALDISTHSSENNINFNKIIDTVEKMDVNTRLVKETLRELLLKVASMKQNLATKILDCYSSTCTVFTDFSPNNDHQQMLEKLTDSKMLPLELRLVRLHKVNPHVLKSDPNQLAAYIFQIDDANSSPLLAQNEKHGLGKYPEYMRSPFIFGLGLNPISVEEMPVIELANRIQHLQSQLDDASKILLGLERMVIAYTEDPHMGNTKDLQPPIKSYGRRIASIKFLQERLATRFEQVGGENKLKSAIMALEQQRKEWEGESVHVPRLEGSQISLSSDSFDSDQEELAPPVSQVPVKVPGSGFVCTAVAQFDYDGCGPGYPPFKKNQRFHVVEVDKTSGWTNVVFVDGTIKGFVPTEYINLTRF